MAGVTRLGFNFNTLYNTGNQFCIDVRTKGFILLERKLCITKNKKRYTMCQP